MAALYADHRQRGHEWRSYAAVFIFTVSTLERSFELCLLIEMAIVNEWTFIDWNLFQCPVHRVFYFMDVMRYINK